MEQKYAYPQSINNIGFFEDFFDGEEKAVVIFWQVENHKLKFIDLISPDKRWREFAEILDEFV
ncbi:methyl-accepting chemotaxis sensory transducer (Precursor) [Candidatus Scalindua japonica]|uniref:Methyl-accepting chemotaxis sensory transducer (Precursor) n=1 Tax=Candidatus Scalindua japonica TaxID=1284222 RepID=A0A286U449_9BACT|nr:hypothetical protein [Candidatus Scalindua japonica]GAX62851.1 methyl-accepting chemotaxis sensory transducer (Precursor) [Candidatus Scalindua japonica]